jgi:hypothetical protein
VATHKATEKIVAVQGGEPCVFERQTMLLILVVCQLQYLAEFAIHLPSLSVFSIPKDK